ncbi:hypothetical protein L208DRAFT_1406957 [Tricholoma matsutake]|nr:hypothetical protein L208DRAFT_1406957 [Tricholoma matsutake 945]
MNNDPLAIVRPELLNLLRNNATFERIAIHEDAQLLAELSAIRKEMSTFRKAHRS